MAASKDYFYRFLIFTLMLNWFMFYEIMRMQGKSSYSIMILVFTLAVSTFFPFYRVRGILTQKLEFADKTQFIDEFFKLMEDVNFHPSAQIESRYFFQSDWFGTSNGVRLTFLNDKECEVRYPGRLARVFQKRMGAYVALKTLSAGIPK